MKINENQKKFWYKMLELIILYKNGDISFYDFIYELEGCLDMGDFQDEVFINKWYEYWTPLEILHATKGSEIKKEDAEEYVSAFELFLKQQLIL